MNQTSPDPFNPTSDLTMNNPEERRKYPRKTTNKVVKVFDLNTDDYLGNVVDISLGGMMLITGMNIESNSVYQVYLKVPDDCPEIDTVAFGGEILWTEDCLDNSKKWAGMHIIDISESARGQIHQLIENFL